MNRIAKILMERDDLTKEEAEEEIKEVQSMMEDCGYNPEECEDILQSQLGLEPDYLMDIIFS